MKHLFFGTDGTALTKPDDVIPFLGNSTHWRAGRSAYEAAHSWFNAQDIPPSVRRVLQTDPVFNNAVLMKAILENKTALDNLGRPSQTDVLAILTTPSGRAVVGVEAKVDETFGPLVSEWMIDTRTTSKPDSGPSGKERRLKGLAEQLGLEAKSIGHLRYQLLHRTVATLIEAKREHAADAAMIVQSFSPSHIRAGFSDFQIFAAAIGCPIEQPGMLSQPLQHNGVRLRLGWAEDRIVGSVSKNFSKMVVICLTSILAMTLAYMLLR
jgi:hypothetical protein